MKPTKTILLVILVSFGLNTVAQVASSTTRASNNNQAIQADDTFTNGQESISINSDATLSNVSIQTKDDCIPPRNLTAEEDCWYYVIHLSWDQPPPPPVAEWISYNDGTFENGLCSTAGGDGLAQMFTPVEYPVTVTEVRYYNTAYFYPDQENEVYVLTGDGSTILAGPYSVTGEPGDTWVTIDVDDITLESGTFMVYTANVLPNGPYVGVDDSFYDGTLYFGSPGDFTELGTWGYYYVGSHEAFVTYGNLSADVVPSSTVLSPANALNNSSAIAVSNHVSAKVERPVDNKQTKLFFGYNIYLYGELIETLWPNNTYDYPSIGDSYHCFTVTSVYTNCESDPSNEACAYLWDGINELGENEVSLYPNPTSNYITITSMHEMIRITVNNYIGQIVYVEDVNCDTKVELNTNLYQEGIYLVKIETESGVVTKRIIIRR